jgi:hypothetical protein
VAYYLVRAQAKEELLPEIEQQLQTDALRSLEPFGEALTKGLAGARRQPDGTVVWEEEDYCAPPLAMERAAVLDNYFTDIRVERVQEGEGWSKIEQLPKLFPKL